MVKPWKCNPRLRREESCNDCAVRLQPDPRRSPRPEPAPSRPRGGSLATRTRFRVATPRWCASRRSCRGGLVSSVIIGSDPLLAGDAASAPGPAIILRRGPHGRRPGETINVVPSDPTGFLHAQDFWVIPRRQACEIIGFRPSRPREECSGTRDSVPTDPEKIRVRLSGRWSGR